MNSAKPQLSPIIIGKQLSLHNVRQDKIVMGNGTDLNIKHIGESYF